MDQVSSEKLRNLKGVMDTADRMRNETGAGGVPAWAKAMRAQNEIQSCRV